MKKIFISLMTVGALLASCANFDEPTAKTFADGPSVDVQVSATADSTFTFTVTPASGANYYTYVVCQDDEVQTIDGETLLKDQVSGLVSECNKVQNMPSITFNMRDASNEPMAAPNTSYVIYAVAGSSDGIPGKVTAVQVKTSDKICPYIDKTTQGTNSVTLTYDDAVVRGDGKISAQYFVEWLGEYVYIPEDSIVADINGKDVTLTAGTIPANCYVLFTLETGAFQDAAGNNSDAAAWGVNTKGAFTGVYYQQTAGSLAFDESYIESPNPGTINDATQPIVINFGQDVYEGTNSDAVINVIYKGTGKTTTYDVTNWTISGKTLVFELPETPAENDVISFVIGAGIVADRYGNENVETALSKVYKYSTVAWKQIGTYTYNYVLYWEGADSQPIYQNEADPSQYKMTNWGGGVDFIFNVAADGTISFDAFDAGYTSSSYGKMMIYDMYQVYGSYGWAPSTYNAETGVFSFDLYYYFPDVKGGWYSEDGTACETMTISASAAKAIAKAGAFKSSKIVAPSKKNFHIRSIAK